MNIHAHAILVVEDDANDVLLLTRAFRKAKVSTPFHVVADGEAAMAYLAGTAPFTNRQQHPLPDLILLDLKLPRVSGLEVLAWLRQEPELKRTPVVVLTSSRENKDINQAYELGANSYLVKPVAFDALLELVQHLNLYWLKLNQNPIL